MKPHELTAFVAAGSCPDSSMPNGRRTMIYVVLADTAAKAEALVLERMATEGAIVELHDTPLPASEVERKALRPYEVIEYSSGR